MALPTRSRSWRPVRPLRALVWVAAFGVSLGSRRVLAQGTRCQSMATPRTFEVPLARGERVRSLWLAGVSSEGLWLGVHVQSRRGERALIRSSAQEDTHWHVIANDQPIRWGSLALAGNREYAWLATASARALSVYAVTGAAGTEPLRTPTARWERPRGAVTTPWLSALGTRLAIGYRGARSTWLATVDVENPAGAPQWVTLARGALGDGRVEGLVPDVGAPWVVLSRARRTISLARVQSDQSVVHARSVACMAGARLVRVAVDAMGAVGLFQRRARGIRGAGGLSQYCVARVEAAGQSHSAVSFPVRSGEVLVVGRARDAVLQLSRPLIVRAIARPAALGSREDYPDVPRRAVSLGLGEGRSAVLSEHAQGRLVLSIAQCTQSAAR
ncbi:MAG: hypothetical protein Q8Q09_13560 [Deltaproteobacteria bacterium]|nr:hypothetical protein [Deltaproteobacteria bacterium]